MACIGQRSGAARSWFQSHQRFQPIQIQFQTFAMSDMSSSVSPSVLPTHDVKGHGPRHTAVQVLLMKTLRHAGSTGQGLFWDVFSKNPASPQSVCLHFLVDHLNKPKCTIQRWTKSMRLAFWKAFKRNNQQNRATKKHSSKRTCSRI